LDIVNRIYDEILNLDIPKSEIKDVILGLQEALELLVVGETVEGEQEAADTNYFRTVLRVEILTDSFWNSDDLAEVAYAITDGDASGVVTNVINSKVSRSKMIELLQDQGSDPSFLVSDYDADTDGER